MARGVFIALLLASVSAALAGCAGSADVRIGSKKFTESVILAEIAAQLCASTGSVPLHRQELGGSRLLWDALRAGEIDIYPEYTGTLTNEIFADRRVLDEMSLASVLGEYGLRVSRSLGFSNNYALGMLRAKAVQLKVASISDLRSHPSLRLGLSNEFMDRADGWPSLRRAYGLDQLRTQGLDHDIAYKGLVSGAIDVTDLYATDAEIDRYGIQILADDQHYFQENKAVLLYRADLEQRAPKALAAMLRLEGALDSSQMIATNAAVKFGGRTEAEVAAQFVAGKFGLTNPDRPQSLFERVLRRTAEHLGLTLSSLLAAIIVAAPLGVIAARRPFAGQLILAFVSILQTIPSLALLVFMIPLLGVGAAPAIAALFLYSLLPIVRNTATGLTSITPSIRNSAIALGLKARRRLLLIELPLASPAILAGMKTAAVINVGTATLGALIGAGGYGQPILTGIRLDNFSLILEGAIPAALLALLVQALFELAENFLVPRGLRLKPGASV